MAKLDPIGRAVLGPFGSALITGKIDLANSLPGVLMGARTLEERRAARDAEAEEKAKKGAIPTMKRGGKVKKMAKGGSTASKRADGCATKGKTKGRFV
jgi:hypothetical protein